MVILDLKLDNIYSFDNFEINFTYKKKIVNNPLGDETLNGFPFFRYRKVNILTGANASGKTTLGKAIMSILNFILYRDINSIVNAVNNRDRECSFTIDYYVGDGIARRIDFVANAGFKTDDDVTIKIYAIKLEKNDSYETYLKKLEQSQPSTNIKDVFNENVGWAFKFPFDTDQVTYDFDEVYFDEYVEILNDIIISLDPAIDRVTKSTEVAKCVNVYFKNGMQPIPVENHRDARTLPQLSSGTKYAFNLAYVYLAIKENLNGFYYVDEQFSYINNDLEKAFISLLSSLINNDEQLIFTTHNTDVLDLNLPHHAYGFLKKENNLISYINASEVEKKNNVSIKNDYENDRFNVAPNLDRIYSLAEMK